MTPEDLETALARALATAAAGLVSPDADSRVDVVAPTRSGRGDWSTTVALRAASEPHLRLTLAEHLCAELRSLTGVDFAEAAGPGFVNIGLTPAARATVAFDIVTAAENDPASELGLDDVLGPIPSQRPQHGGPSPWSLGGADRTAVAELQRGHAAACRERRRAVRAEVSTDGAEAARLDHPSETRLLNALASVPAGLDRSHRLGACEPVLHCLLEVADACEDWLCWCAVTPTVDVDITAVHASRLVLVRAAIIVLAAGLRQLGASAPERI